MRVSVPSFVYALMQRKGSERGIVAKPKDQGVDP